MEKIIAVVTQKGALSKGLQHNTIVNLFRMKNDKVTGVENINLEEVNENKFSLLLALKEVSVVYLESVSKDLIRILHTIGITTKLKDEMDGDEFIQKFIFD